MMASVGFVWSWAEPQAIGMEHILPILPRPGVWLSREARPGGNCVCYGQGSCSGWGWRVASTQSLLVLVLWGHGGEIQHL